MSDEQLDLIKEATKVLKHNDRGKWIVPAGDLYPHQWLWDSCFIAIGLRHLSVERAQIELRSLLRGQWSNGMLPNIIFTKGNKDKQARQHRELWRSYVSPYSPDNEATSGITQPPMLAEAVVRVGKKLKMPERRSWYLEMYPALVNYHEWLYRDRDPHKEGLIVLLHPYESGLDDTPPWISELYKHNMPLWIKAIKQAHLDGVVNLIRRDTKHVLPGQRMSNTEAMAYWAAIHRIRRKAYNSEAILSRSLFAVEDLAFNSILVRANSLLREIAKNIKRELPTELVTSMLRTEKALEELWDETTGQYFYRSFVSHHLIEESTVAALLPLYAGSISKEHAQRLLELLKSSKWFKASWPIPSVPLNSPYFSPFRYWQGPSWVNINWLIIDGLERNGYENEANLLRERTIQMVKKSGFAEYFNPQTGEQAGAQNFSWTAALTIDLLKH